MDQSAALIASNVAICIDGGSHHKNAILRCLSLILLHVVLLIVINHVRDASKFSISWMCVHSIFVFSFSMFFISQFQA